MTLVYVIDRESYAQNK